METILLVVQAKMLTTFETQPTNYNQTRTKVYHNLTINSAARSWFMADDFPGTYTDMEIYNNTFYAPINGVAMTFGSGSSDASSGYRFYNNIIHGYAGNPDVLRIYGDATNMVSEMNYNQYGGANFRIVDGYNHGSTAYGSLANWQASGAISGGANPDVNSLSSDPLFVNASGNFNTISDFELQLSSPCKGTGKDGKDMGAGVTLVGIQNEVIPDTTPPSAPSGLSVS